MTRAWLAALVLAVLIGFTFGVLFVIGNEGL